MSRSWLAVYTAMATKPKYRRLSPISRGALLHVFILAGFQNPEATWSDPEELRDALRLENFPDACYDELLGLQWLEVEDGAVVVHDWDEHQRAATKEAQRAWEAARKKEWRNKKREPSSPAPSPPTRQDITPQHKGPGHGTDVSGTPGLEEVAEVYRGLFGPISEGKLVYLGNIVTRWPADRVMEGLRLEKSYGATPKNICGRLEEKLKNGDKLKASQDYQAIQAGVDAHAASEITV